MISSKKILVTGATGRVAGPIAIELGKTNEVWCAARFSNPATKDALESHGLKTVKYTLGDSDLSAIPSDFNYVIHSACNIRPANNSYEISLKENAEGTGLLMHHCRRADAFLFVSSAVVYQPNADPGHAFVENDPLGGGSWFIPTYGVGKVATEAVVRTLARLYELPTIIARLGTAYGTAGVDDFPARIYRKLMAREPIYHPSTPSYLSVIHQDDLNAHIEPLLKAARVPARTVNWATDEVVDELEMYRYVAQVCGMEPNLIADDSKAVGFRLTDATALKAITGPFKVRWKDGMLRSLRAGFPGHTFSGPA